MALEKLDHEGVKKIKQVIDTANKQIDLFKILSYEEIKKNAKKDVKIKDLEKENIFLKEEVLYSDNIIEKYKLKIESIVSNTCKINEEINSFGITKLEYETLEEIRNDLYNKTMCEETEKRKEDDSYNKYIEYRNEKRKNNENLL